MSPLRFSLVSVLNPVHLPGSITDGIRAVNHDQHLVHVLSGQGRVRVGSQAVPFSRGVVLSLPPLEPYEFFKSRPCRFEMINFHYTLDGAAARLPVSFTPASFGRIEQRLREGDKQWRSGTPAGRLRATVMLLDLVCEYVARFGEPIDPAAATDPLMEDVRHRLASPQLVRYSATALAGAVHLSVSQLNRRFRAAHGLSPHTYWRQQRLAAVQRQLRTTAMPMKEIAQRFGFSDQFYFSRWFKTQTGVSPRAFRAAGAAV